MYGWILRSMIRRDVRKMREGDVRPLLSRYADDAVLVFPGVHSWGREYHGKTEIEQFLRRFLAAGLEAETHEILVQGPPWRTHVCIRLTDHADGPDGHVVYENRAVIFATIRWAKIVAEEVYEDTQKVVALDAYLAEHQLAPA